ncbi:Integral membrane protein, putative [Penicillium digitatum]|uniref:Integral membrane protein, putative n=3 Tax=Penicillium digitatum TaxID=36651 RepID=K9FAU3_PEND2|nr:Integral membrane protein, putative [Penicillium digitatum Pd1]EKV06545.1 Integral membrane protein, putative [Penicillium digitatum PHI26]EKV21617.1 Integral membrane protein, putative [Penicillium digitatum Pd1]KAG0154461.1 hypothetical protein PDIDSM_29 [Penicillium digitatum]QQK47465.1 Integral membrane protein, putative [Penicillium digitatum]
MEARFVPLEGVNLDDSRNKAMLIVTSVFFAISLLSVILRCFVRTHVVRAWGWDDGTMVIAMALNTAFAICGIVGCKYGLGRKTVYFAQYPDHFHRAMLCWWVGQLFYVLTCVVAKLSIIIALLRITISRVHAYILYGAMILATAVGLIFFFFTMFQCSPVDYFWKRAQPNTHGACINRTLLIGIAYLYSIGAAITDLTIGLIPVALIWNLRMNRRTKGAIAVILGIGSIASAAVIIRIPYIPTYKDPDFLYATSQLSIWSNIEAGIGITAGCLTTLRPIIRIFRDSSSDVTPQSFPLSNNVAGAFHRSMRSNQISRDDAHQLWTGTGSDEYHGVTTTISTAQKQLNSSEDDLTAYSNDPDAPRWRVERSVRVSVRNS